MLGSHIWFGTNSFAVYHSSDNGNSWVSQPTPGQQYTYALAFNSITAGAAGSVGIFNTTNSGNNWVLNSSSPSQMISGLTGDMNNTYWAIANNLIYRTTDNGITWTNEHSIPSGAYHDITLARNGGTANGNLWAVGSFGQITAYGNVSGISPINNSVVTEYKLAQNFPNPFNPETKINFAIPKTGFTTLKVYSMEGREEASLLNENLSPGNYTVSFNAASSGTTLSSGIYFYILRSGNYTETKKMMLVK